MNTTNGNNRTPPRPSLAIFSSSSSVSSSPKRQLQQKQGMNLLSHIRSRSPSRTFSSPHINHQFYRSRSNERSRDVTPREEEEEDMTTSWRQEKLNEEVDGGRGRSRSREYVKVNNGKSNVVTLMGFDIVTNNNNKTKGK
ncbi:hypothetical protein G210_4266 [Candida maltosa Xu316]|uniref:Uncharacterized protein n=1 Tax=Candida maltosa (strain Xu316) TaxID=1245528 RepID=M3J124_CANMX|nr:hypothetical protein G210_4266 [Candida maltosa Xu316]